MTMSGTGVLPASEVVQQWRTIADAIVDFRISEASWKALATKMGDEDVTDLEMTASITDDDYEAARDSCGAKALQKAAFNRLFAGLLVWPQGFCSNRERARQQQHHQIHLTAYQRAWRQQSQVRTLGSREAEASEIC